jgi:hypothetical protein
MPPVGGIFAPERKPANRARRVDRCPTRSQHRCVRSVVGTQEEKRTVQPAPRRWLRSSSEHCRRLASPQARLSIHSNVSANFFDDRTRGAACLAMTVGRISSATNCVQWRPDCDRGIPRPQPSERPDMTRPAMMRLALFAHQSSSRCQRLCRSGSVVRRTSQHSSLLRPE